MKVMAVGINIRGGKSNHLRYANDPILLAKSKEDFNKPIREIKQ